MISNGLDCGGAASPSHEKPITVAPKKAALRDVQNENAGVQLNGDAIKVSGTKRMTPDRLLISQSTIPSLTYNGINENIMNANRRLELELGRGRLQSSVERFSDSKNLGQMRRGIPHTATQLKDNNVRHVSVTTPSTVTATVASVPSSVGRYLTTSVPIISPKVEHNVDIKSTSEQLRAERYIRLQKFLKQCDESNNEEFIQMLLHMPFSDLSKFAIDLEKRAIDLAMEEGIEMKRVKALNVLAKPSPTTTNSLQSPQ